jgi:uncharacterized protein YcbX
VAHLSAINRFPIKSCRGWSVDSAVVEPWGLAGDRRWMVVDEAGEVFTAREANRLVLVRPELTSDGLRLTAPDLPPLDVPTPDPAGQVPVAIWSSQLTAATAGSEADAWFSKAIGRTARLVHLDDPTRRPTTEASLAALNDVVVERSEGAHPPLPMTRFRPNVVVAGTEAWEEDDWRRIRIGDAVFRAVKGCARCVLTTIDPETAVRGREPIASLARVRRWDGATWFGVNLVPDTPGATIRVDDEVEVLESVPPGGGPIRPGATQR